MKRTKNLVSVLTINMNQNQVTVDFLESLRNSSYKNIEVIVVDQNSDENPTRLFEKVYPGVSVIISPTNVGFTGGNNLALEYSIGEYIFCVNNDTIVPSDLIGKLVEPFQLQPSNNIGIVSPKILYYQDPTIIQYSGYTELNPYTGRNSSPGKGHKNAPRFSMSGQTAYAHGCAMMIPYKVIEEADGFLDDTFFIYYEELDFSQRVKNLGYKIWYQGDTHILHRESMTTGKDSTFKEYFHTRNRIYFMRKHNKTKLSLFVYSVYVLALIVPKKLVQYLPTRKFTHIKAMFKGISWNINNFFYKI